MSPTANPHVVLFECLYFARNIMNIVACEGLQRLARPEPHASWLARLQRAGFQPSPVLTRVADAVHEEMRKFPAGFGMLTSPGGLQMTWRGKPMLQVAVSTAAQGTNMQ